MKPIDNLRESNKTTSITHEKGQKIIVTSNINNSNKSLGNYIEQNIKLGTKMCVIDTNGSILQNSPH
jgi:hypothetical protein